MSQNPKIKHDWYQTETAVVVELRVKGCQSDDVKVEFTDKTLSVSVKMPNSPSEYSLELDLAHPILPEQSHVRTLATKIEITMKKADGSRWPDLEREDVGSVDAKKYPSSSGKDWNRIGAEIEMTFEDDKPEGEQALNQMFQKIYADGSDEVKRAMNKSFSESGGTVLSTNWDDIKKDKVDVKPPDGMEFKKWD